MKHFLYILGRTLFILPLIILFIRVDEEDMWPYTE